MKNSARGCVLIGALAIAGIGNASALTFSTFVSGGDLYSELSNNSTIGFAYAGNKFVGSVYFGTNNNQLYSTNLSGGAVAKFGAPLPTNYTGEIYVSSSLGLGGYGARDIYAGSEALGQIYRISNDGSSQGVFANSGISGGVRSIAFDPYGLYGNNMIVATSLGNIYRVSNTGVATFLANVGEDAEGLSFAPGAFAGKAAGTLFVASERSGSLRAIDPTGNVTTVIQGLYGAEMVSFVPTNLCSSGNPIEGFYAASYPNNIVKASCGDFVSYLGDAIITGETGHQVWDLKSNGTYSQLGFFPAQPEDGIFVTADIIRGGDVPEPASLALLGLGIACVGISRRKKA